MGLAQPPVGSLWCYNPLCGFHYPGILVSGRGVPERLPADIEGPLSTQVQQSPLFQVCVRMALKSAEMTLFGLVQIKAGEGGRMTAVSLHWRVFALLTCPSNAVMPVIDLLGLL